MSNVIAFSLPRRAFGMHHRCPYCPYSGDRSIEQDYVNVGPVQWAVCEQHGVKWLLGTNLAEGWRTQTVEDWIANREFLEGLKLVYSVGPKQHAPEQEQA